MKRSYYADLTLLIVAFVWGTTFVLVQSAIATLPPHTFNAIRFFLAAFLLLLLMLLFFRDQLKAISLKMIVSGSILGIWLFGGYTFQTIGLLYTSSSKAGFITGLSVVLIPVFGLVVQKQRLQWPSLVSVVIALIGLYLLTLGDSLSLNKGDMLVFLCAICFASQIIVTGKYAPHFPSLSLALIQIFVVSILSGFGAILFEDWQSAIQLPNIGQPIVIWALLITAGPATAFAFLAQTICQKFTTPTRVALIFAMEPVFAAIASFIWTEDVLGVKALAGCLLIFSGMILSEIRPEQFRAKRKKSITQ